MSTNDLTRTQSVDIAAVMNMSMQVMAYSVFASALGQMAAAATLDVPLSAQKPTDPAIQELRSMYGTDLVNKAIALSLSGDIVDIARNVDALVVETLINKYGEDKVDLALTASPPGDMRRVIEICKGLSIDRITSESPPQKIAESVNRSIERTNQMAGRSKAQPIYDTKTGKAYGAKWKAGDELAKRYAAGLEHEEIFNVLDTDRNWRWGKIVANVRKGGPLAIQNFTARFKGSENEFKPRK